MASTHGAQPTTKTTLSADAVLAEVTDRRPDSVTAFGQLSESQREQLTLDAWVIGLRALGNAQAEAREARLADVGASLLDDLDRQLRVHVEPQQQTIATILDKYFDPNEGQVTQRLRAFVDDHGVLAQLLHRYLGPQSSVLAETLARQVGEQSELFKKLSATDSEGLVKVLERQLYTVMNQGHADLVKALDPLAEDGAVARFLRSLREELKGADEDRASQLAKALAGPRVPESSSRRSGMPRTRRSAPSKSWIQHAQIGTSVLVYSSWRTRTRRLRFPGSHASGRTSS